MSVTDSLSFPALLTVNCISGLIGPEKGVSLGTSHQEGGMDFMFVYL